MNEIVMPKLSDTMTEGRLVSWKKRVGEAVRRGDVLAEVETDKANMELEAFVSGELLEIRVQAGELAQVGTVIAVIGKPEEKGAGAAQPSAPVPKGEPAAAEPQEEAPPVAPPVAPEPPRPKEPEAKEEAKEGEGEGKGALPGAGAPVVAAEKAAKAEDIAPAEGEKQAPAAPPVPGTGAAREASQPAGAGGVEPKPPPAAAKPAVPGPAEAEISRERAAPMVRRRARELGIDLSQVQGSGPDGRILLQDLEQHQRGEAQPAQPAQQPAPAQPAAQAAAAHTGEEPRPMPRLRAAVAKTVAESWDNIPHFTVTMDIVMDEAESVRRQLKQSGMSVTLNDVVIKGVSLALQKFPQLNASFLPRGIQFHSEINISIAVGMPDGVLMPVLPGCQRLSLLEISQGGSKLVERARSGALTEQEMSGGTFSVSNLGMFGVSSFSAIIHPAQTAVLAVGAVIDAPSVRNGVLASAKVMKVTLSADHRVVDGAYAAQFLVELKGVLENPVRLLI